LHGLLYGAAWGLVSHTAHVTLCLRASATHYSCLSLQVSPIPHTGSAEATRQLATGVFKPVPPFSSLSGIPSNALFFGSILGMQRFCAKSMELVRRQEDGLNDIFGFGMIWPYYRYVLNYSERRLLWHNRILGSAVVVSVVYANFLS
jgi:hypothetical protein